MILPTLGLRRLVLAEPKRGARSRAEGARSLTLLASACPPSLSLAHFKRARSARHQSPARSGAKRPSKDERNLCGRKRGASATERPPPAILDAVFAPQKPFAVRRARGRLICGANEGALALPGSPASSSPPKSLDLACRQTPSKLARRREHLTADLGVNSLRSGQHARREPGRRCHVELEWWLELGCGGAVLHFVGEGSG